MFFAWISANIGTIIVALVVVAIVVIAAAVLIRDKKKGKTSVSVIFKGSKGMKTRKLKIKIKVK